MDLAPLFYPRAICIYGASADLKRISGQPIKALRAAGFPRSIHLVNPKYQSLHDLPCYPTAQAIPERCDLAIVALPADGVPAAIEDCGKAGVRFAVILTAGFRETGDRGSTLEAELKATAHRVGVRLIGPNCQGMISVPDRVWAAFGSIAEETEIRAGGVSCAFQSGGFGYAIVNLAEAQGLGFRHCISTGNETDVTTPELIDGLLDDQGTDLVFALMEGTPDARRLLDVGRKSLRLGKPVLIWKSANTDAGAKAAQSHTANMTGRADLFRAAFRQAGIIEVGDVEPIVDIAKLFAQKRLPEGHGVGVISISGGSGIVFADRATTDGLVLPPFAPETVAALAKVIPAFGSSENPADVTAGVFNDMGLLTKTLEIVLADPGIDQLAVLLASLPGIPALKAAEAIAIAAASSDKPVHVAWSGRRAKSEDAYRVFEAHNVPIVPTPVRLAAAASVLAKFSSDRRRAMVNDRPSQAQPTARQILHQIPRANLPTEPGPMSELASKAVLAAFGISITREVMVPINGDTSLINSLKPPFAVKVVSAAIAHKSDIGGVILNVSDSTAAASAITTVITNAQRAMPHATIDGALVSEMAQGLELIVGVINDPAFGPCVALGLGGVLTEILKDITYRVAPFDQREALRMITELKAQKLLDGYRGQPGVDRAALADLLVAVSDIALALGDRLVELDINPVFADGHNLVAADALLVLR